MKLIATTPILYFAHQYQIGDELPLRDQVMVNAWLNAGTAKWLDDNQEQEVPTERPKARMVTARPGQIGISTTGNEEDLTGRIPDSPERHV